jgi:hypothetical protein
MRIPTEFKNVAQTTLFFSSDTEKKFAYYFEYVGEDRQKMRFRQWRKQVGPSAEMLVVYSNETNLSVKPENLPAPTWKLSVGKNGQVLRRRV